MSWIFSWIAFIVATYLIRKELKYEKKIKQNKDKKKKK
jgi:hypothetical protein